MTHKDSERLTSLRWTARAKRTRGPVSNSVGAAIHVKPEDVTFLDRNHTERVKCLFRDRVEIVSTHELPSRTAAIALAMANFPVAEGSAYLLPRGYDDCGAIAIDFRIAIDCLDKLLSSQQEIIRIISENGSNGLCISSQEGSDEHFPRYVQIW